MVQLPPDGKNGLYYGDNWDILRAFPDAFVDLIYIDPPFNSQRNYNVVFDNSIAEEKAFEDTWSRTSIKEEEEVILAEPQRYSVLIDYLSAMETLLSKENPLYCYLLMMSVRVVELHRVLKPTGSFYLHCDPTASHYLKTLMDRIFGQDNFLNEIIWQRTNVHNDAKRWGPVSDTLLFYKKGKTFTWNPAHLPHSKEHLAAKYGNQDPDGRRYTLSDMTSPNPRPNMMYEWKGHKSPPMGWRYSKDTMSDLDAKGLIYYPDSKDKRPRLKRYLDEMAGSVVGNVWADINPINARAAERLGYPTQKPLALMERILAASTNPGDLVLDAFCGCGTTVAAAEKLGRKWIGIDITFRAVDLIQRRLTKEFYGNSDLDFRKHVYVHGVPQDIESAIHLAKETDKLRKEFEKWACTVLGGVFQEKKGADAGQDGFIPFPGGDGKTLQCVIQVKSGGISLKDAKELNSTIDQFRAPCGVLFTIEPPTRPIRDYIAQLPPFRPTWAGQELEPIPRIQVITVQEHFDGKKPNLPARMRIEKAAEPVVKPGPKQKKLAPE